MVDLRTRGRRCLVVLSAVMLGGVLAVARPAAALAGDTITDPQDTPGGLDIQQATRAPNTAAGTMTITITTYAPFTNAQTNFDIVIDTTASGTADVWVPIRYNMAAQSLVAGIGLAGSFHLSPVTASRPSTTSVAVTFPLAAIHGSMIGL